MGSLYILIAIFLWSSLGIVVRLSGIEIHILIFYSLLVAICTQGMIILLRKDIRHEARIVKKIWHPAILGIVLLANTFSFFYAFKNTTIANAVLTHYTAPIIVAFLAPFFLKEVITKNIIFAIIIASTGLWIMLGGFSFDERQTAGILAGLFSGFAYAILILLMRFYSKDYHPLVLSFLMNVTIALLLLPFIHEIPFHAIWSILFMGIAHSTVAPILYLEGLKTVTANKTAILGYLEPVCAILLSIVLLNEMPGVKSILGGSFILFSGYLTLKKSKNGTEIS